MISTPQASIFVDELQPHHDMAQFWGWSFAEDRSWSEVTPFEFDVFIEGFKGCHYWTSTDRFHPAEVYGSPPRKTEIWSTSKRWPSAYSERRLLDIEFARRLTGSDGQVRCFIRKGEKA